MRWPRGEQLQDAETIPRAGKTKENDEASKPGVRATQEARTTVPLPRGCRSHVAEATAAPGAIKAWERRHALASHFLSHPISFQYLPLAKPSWKPVSKGVSLMWFLRSVPLQHRAKLGKVGNIFKDKKTKKDMKAHPKSPFSFHYPHSKPSVM